MRFFVLFLFATLSGFDCIDIRCEIRSIPWNNGEHYETCVMSGLIVKSSSAPISDRTVSSITGLLGEVHGLVVENQEMRSFPVGLEKFIPDLERIRIYNSKLQSIQQSDLKPFYNLKQLLLMNNEIEVFPDDVFDSNPKLERFYFTNNQKLKVMSANSLLHPNLININIQNLGCSYLGSAYYYNGVTCLEPEQLKKLLFLEQFEKLNEEVRTLESKVNLLQLSFESADGNLNSATKSMLTTSKALRSCGVSEVISRLSNEQNVELNCESNDDESLCIATGFKVEFDDMKIEKYSMDPSKLESLTINNQQTLFLPTNLGEMFSNLKELIVTNSGLFNIENSFLTGFFNLQTLILKGNKIQEIPLDAFAEVKTLKKLDLSENRIEKLEDGIFNRLESLVDLNLKNNLLITVKAETFEPLINLQILNLSGNKLKFISVNLLTLLSSIEIADFTNNNCINISFPEDTKETFKDTFIDNCVLPVDLNCSKDTSKEKVDGDENVCSIQDLTIRYPKTRISKVNFADDKTTSDISALKIIDQSMKFIPYQLSSAFPNITSIVIENSQLTSLLKNDFQGFKNLKTISISGNNLTSIEEGTFDELTELEMLDLSSNEIILLPTKLFYHLKNVKKLILSFNLIEKFTANLLPVRSAIEEFRINDNQLEIIETRTLRFLRKAKVIDFSNNTCIDMKFEKTDTNRKSLLELSGEIDLSCSSDD